MIFFEFRLPQLAASVRILLFLMVLICRADPSYKRSVLLYNDCSKGYVGIFTNGDINAESENITQFQNLTIMSDSDLNLLIKSEASNRYMCVNKKGRLIAKKKIKNTLWKCQFKEYLDRNGYNQYSYRIRDKKGIKRERFLAFNSRGKFVEQAKRSRCYNFIPKNNIRIKEHNQILNKNPFFNEITFMHHYRHQKKVYKLLSADDFHFS